MYDTQVSIRVQLIKSDCVCVACSFCMSIQAALKNIQQLCSVLRCCNACVRVCSWSRCMRVNMSKGMGYLWHIDLTAHRVN